MLRIVLAAGLAGLIASTAVAQPSSATGTTEPATNPSTTADTSGTDPDKVICKNVKPPTGTRVGSSRNRQRICQTRAQWDEQAREAQEQLRQRDKGLCSNGACSG